MISVTVVNRARAANDMMKLSLRQSCRLSRAATVALRRLSSSSNSDYKSQPEVFQRAKRGKFSQAQPELRNPFIEDPYLQACLVRLMPSEVRVNVICRVLIDIICSKSC